MFAALIVLTLAQNVPALSGNSAAGVDSDEFEGTSLSSTWAFVDPLGDSSVSVNGGAVSISVPAGSNHDIWSNGVNVARIMQPVSNDDFEIEVRFDSQVTQRYQMQGIVLKRADEGYLRFGNYHDGNLSRAFIAFINPSTNTAQVLHRQVITPSPTSYFRLTRSGNSWTYERSTDGVNWQTLKVLSNYTFAMASMGIYAGNLSGPAHTTVATYFRDIAGAGPTKPTAIADSYSTDEDTPLNIAAPGVLSNDTDPEENSLTAVLDSTTSNGSLTLNSDGSFSYTPNANFNGADSFTYVASDGGSQSTPATVSITIDPINDAPVADGQSVALEQDSSLLITLAATDADLDTLTYQVTSDPSNGSLTGSAPDVTYIPDAGYFGTDSFTFTASDAQAPSNEATVSITVHELNDAPTAQNDAYPVSEDNTLNVVAPGVLANDTDPESDPLTAALISGVSNGLLTLSPDGSFSYTPAANFFGSDSFTYRAEDAINESGSATVTITVDPVNDAPAATPQAVITAMDAPLAITLTGSDVENDSLTFTVTTQPSNGVLTGTGANRTYTPNSGYVGSDSFQFTASDAGGPGAPATVQISVQSAGNLFSDEFSGGSLAPAWTLVDPRGDSTVTVNGGKVSISAPAGVNHDLWSSGAWAPRIMQQAPNEDFQVEAKFDSAVSEQYQLQGFVAKQDNSNYLRFGHYYDGSNVQAFIAFINPVSNTSTEYLKQPVTGAVPTYLRLTREGDIWTFERSTDGTNWQTLDTLERPFNLTELGLYGGAVAGPGHTAVIDYFREVVETEPTQPTAVADSYSMNEDTTLNVTAPGVLGNDTDPEFNPLSAVLNTTTSNGSLTLNSNGSFTYVPNANFNGSDSFTYTASDGATQSDPATVSITVNPVNDVPVAQSQSVSLEQDSSLAITLVATDVESGSLTYQVTQGPANGTLSGSGPNRTYTPDAGYNGPDSFKFTASDGSATSNEATVSITVFEVNGAPVAANDSYATDEDVVLNVATPGVLGNDSDPDTDPITAELVSDVSNGTLALNSDGSFTYTPDADFNGADSFTYRASDQVETSAPATVTITVNPVNDTPEATPQSVSTTVDTAVPVTLTGTDADNDPLDFLVTQGPANGTLSGTAPDLIYTPDSGFVGADSFEFTVSDASETSAPATVQIDVADPGAIFSDEFDGSSLAPAWTFVNPTGHGNVSVSGGTVSISVPAGTNHDVWSSGVNAPRIMQSVANEDFQIDVKFDSQVTQQYQLQGILVKQGANTYLRFGNYSDGSASYAFTAFITVGGTSPTYTKVTVSPAATTYLRVTRSGNSWTFQRSIDGINWQTVAAFSRTFTVSEIGVYSGNLQGPAHTSVIDYFRDTMQPPTTQPEAVSDSYSTDEDSVLNVAAPGVLGNDSDPEEDPLTAVLISNAVNGSVTLNPDGSFTYTPDADFYGADMFSYRATDGSTYSATTLVTVTVNGSQDPPTALHQSRITGLDTPLAIMLTGYDPDGDPLTFDVVSQPANGTLSVDEPNITYTPDPGFLGIDSFTFTASDAGTTSAPATIEIDVRDLSDGLINVFYGNEQHFNTVGRPQRWVDVLGNASDADGIASLTYSLNGGPENELTVGPGSGVAFKRRLYNDGDFIVQIDYDDLNIGANEVVITMIDLGGNVSQEIVTVHYAGRNFWPLNYSIDWSTVTDIQDVVQVIDGYWVVTPDGVTTDGETGYDRLLAVGDMTWTEFTATVPFTVHDFDPTGNWCCGVGLFIRWVGHTNTPDYCEQPICGWEPYGNDAWYRWDSNGGHSDSAAGNIHSLIDSSGMILQLDVTYIMKVEVEVVDGKNWYRKKVWAEGYPEPEEWMVEVQRNTNTLYAGSLLLVAHHTDVTFGDIVIEPVDEN